MVEAKKVMKHVSEPPVVTFAGMSGSGKTTFVVKLIPVLTGRGFKVGTVKHDVHGFDMDRPGKDTWRHRQAGSSVTVVSSPHGIGMVKAVDHDHHLSELLPLFEGMDIVVAEGYKRADVPKIEVVRADLGARPILAGDEWLLAVVGDVPDELHVPRFSFGDVEGVADFLVNRFGLGTDRGTASEQLREPTHDSTQAVSSAG